MRRLIPSLLAIFAVVFVMVAASPAIAAAGPKPAQKTMTTKVHTAKTPHAKKKTVAKKKSFVKPAKLKGHSNAKKHSRAATKSNVLAHRAR